MAPQTFDLALYNAELERQLGALRNSPDYQAAHQAAMDVMRTPAAAPVAPTGSGLMAPTILGAKLASHFSAPAVSGIGPIADGAKYAQSISPASTTTGLGLTPYLGVAGAGLGAYGMYNALKSHDTKSGALSGLALGGGLAAAAPLLGFSPVGWAGLGLASLLGAGGGVGLAALSGMGDKDQFKTEYNRAQKLRDSGVNWHWNADTPRAGRSKQQLIDEATANGGNIDFAKTRDEKYLTGKDLVGFSFLPEKFGNSYASAGLDKQIKAAQMIADAGAADERKGSMFYNKNFSPELEAKISAFLSGQTTPSVASKIGPIVPYSKPARSQTSSPGIRKDGRRISYAAKK